MAYASQGAVTATEVATVVVDAGWSYFSVFNAGSVTVWRGFDATVTAATGTPIAVSTSVMGILPWASSDSPTIYLVTAAGTTSDCRILTFRG